MSIIGKVKCSQCGKEYSPLKKTCPHCGARPSRPSERASATSSSAKRGTQSNARAVTNANWQMIFGLIVIVAVVAAVIALISIEIGSRQEEASASAPPVIESGEPTVSPTPTATPTPTPSPTPSVTSITITYYGSERTEFMLNIGADKAVKMSSTVYPLEAAATAKTEWSSADESIMKVDETGLCTGIKAGTTTLIAEIGNVKAECKVIVA